MCGRCNIITEVQPLIVFFEVATTTLSGPYARYNIAPSSPKHRTMVPIVRTIEGQRHMVELVWPLIPGWAKDNVIYLSHF